MSQEHLATAVTSESELLHNFGLLGLGDGGTVEVRALAIGIALLLLEATLVMEPLIGEQFATVHTADGNDHTTLGRRFSEVTVVKFGPLAHRPSSVRHRRFVGPFAEWSVNGF